MSIRYSKLPWWLIVGSITYILMVTIGSIAYFDASSMGDTVYAVIDWLAASIIYFFLGAFYGHIIDWYFSIRKGSHQEQNKHRAHPFWWWMTLGFWVASAIISLIFTTHNTQGVPWLYLFFPYTFGIFLPAFAYNLFVPELLQEYAITKVLLNLGFITIFCSWLYAFLRNKVFTQRILLTVLFLILLLGMVSCVSSLS